MKTKLPRRSFLGVLAGLPCLGWLGRAKADDEKPYFVGKIVDVRIYTRELPRWRPSIVIKDAHDETP